MIVIEGMDNSGKSSLALAIRQSSGLPITESEGPPKSREEINARVRRYLADTNRIYVRHPCVSNPIYDFIREPDNQGWIDEELLVLFYAHNPLFIYCDPLHRGMVGHTEKDYDSADHMARVNKWYVSLLFRYRNWAIRSAHMIYRIGDDINRVLELAQGEYR